MELKIPKEFVIKWAKEVGINTDEDRIFPDGVGYYGRVDNVTVDSQFLKPKQIDKLLSMAKAGMVGLEEDSFEWQKAKKLYKKMQRQVRILKQARVSNETTIPTTLPLLMELLKKYIEKADHRWLFREDGDLLQPVMVFKLAYTKRTKREEGLVEINYRYRSIAGTHTGSIQFFRNALKHSTVEVLLEKKGYHLETPELLEDYQDKFKEWDEYRDMFGEQFLAFGKARRQGGDSRNFVLATPGAPVKVIMEDFETKVTEVHEHYWDTDENTKPDPSLSEEEQEEQELAGLGFRSMVPIHLYLKVFSLVHHESFEVMVDDLELYEYDESIVDKLILPDEVKELVDFVISSVGVGMGDIVKGKSAGVIILSQGLPGVGKTLTGEVYAEKIKRPLYVVQAAQLGLTIDELETKLKVVLERATSWRALLMIDEADVYIHERGNDMVQNAVVGTFLRVLEYYQGVLFMTTNRANIIDDAILSRCNAIVKYEPPTVKDQKKIWKVLSTEMDVKMDKELIDSVVSKFNYLTGREIGKAIKLAALYANRMKKKLDLAAFEKISVYQHYVNAPEKGGENGK